VTAIRKTLDREQQFLDIALEGEAIATRIGLLATVLNEDMEQLHGQEFRVVIDHDTPLILIRLK